MFQTSLKGEAPGRPPLQLHRDVLEGPRPVLHPGLRSGAAGLLLCGGYVASAPSGSTTIALQCYASRTALLRLLSGLETLGQRASPRRK